MIYKCVIFDMDGTLLDTLDDLTDSCNYALEAHGMPARTKDEVRQFVGNGVRRLISLAVPEGTPEDVCSQVLATYKEHYQVHCNDRAHPYFGITELLTALREKDIRLAVVSNKPDAAVKELCDLHFPGIFDVVIGEQEKLTRKPAPDMVKAALKKLRINRRDAVYIGDSEVDIKTARNASLDLITVSWGFRDRDTLTAAGAKTIASTPDEVLSLLNETNDIRHMAKWALRNWNAVVFAITCVLYLIYMNLYERIGSSFTWEEFNHDYYWPFIFCLPLTLFIHIIAVFHKAKHRFLFLVLSFFLWFFVQAVTVGRGV